MNSINDLCGKYHEWAFKSAGIGSRHIVEMLEQIPSIPDVSKQQR
jgi:hypothetical protein